MVEPRPVTACLEAEITGELRRRAIVVWLDRDEHYTEYVDGLAGRFGRGEFPYPVVAFRGSFLEMMLALEDLEGGLDQTQVLIHMPGFTEDMMRGTPLLELYKAGYRHRRALDTLVREAATGQIPPDEIEKYLAAKDEGLSLAEADVWLGSRLGTGKQGLAGLLDRTSLEVVVRELLIKDTFLGDQLDRNRSEDLEVLRSYFVRQLGMTDEWVEFVRGGDTQSKPYGVLMEALASWILCVEYVDDLTRAPHLEVLRPMAKPKLPDRIVAVCRDLARGLREQHPDAYESLADQVEAHLGGELSEIRPEDLGRIDTFRTEESRILEAAVGALIEGNCSKAREWAGARAGSDAGVGEVSFWLGRDQRRKIAWSLVADAALLGCLLDEQPRPFEGVASYEEAAERYGESVYRVDLAHRRFEQRRDNLLGPQLPHFAKMKEAVVALRQRYQAWADDLARDFSALCRKKGLLPDSGLQQRNLYEQVVHPLTQGNERTAVFLVDALRYEMATELVEEMKEPGTKVSLTARFAELPTITSVGMNALAPVAQGGRLVLAGGATGKGFKGFSTGEYTVDDPEDRCRAMGLRSIGERALGLGLAEICEMDPATLKKKVAQKRLIVVHDREIDEAGEAGVGLKTFEDTLSQIKAAWHHLKAAGVRQSVFTSDHGFLLEGERGKRRAYGKKTDPSRRHVLASERRVEEGLVTVSLAELGYEGREGYLLFNEDTAVFDTGDRAESFVHGGNSPQERIIPVLRVTNRFPPAVDLAAYRVVAEPEPDAMGCHRIRTRLELDKEHTDTLPFVRSAPIDLALRVPNRGEIRAVVKDVTGVGSAKGGRLQLPVGETWAEVFFNLEGPEDERVRVEVFHPDGIEQVIACQVEGWFDVEGKERLPTVEPPQPEEWEHQLPDDGTRQIFVHLHRHESITEAEAVGMLGSPRLFRRFSQSFESYLALTPLRVRIEVTAGGKRYVREGKTDGTR